MLSLTKEELSLLLEVLAEAKVNAENIPTPEETLERQKAIDNLRITLCGE